MVVSISTSFPKAYRISGIQTFLARSRHQSLPAIPTLKKAMPGITSWSLETIFPAFFPGSNLVDGNHDARVDTRQLAKLLALRFELAELLDGRSDRLLSVWPVHERGFHGSPNPRQTGIRAEESVDTVPEPTGSIALGIPKFGRLRAIGKFAECARSVDVCF